MKTLTRLSAVLLAACGSEVRLVQTYSPEPEPVGPAPSEPVEVRPSSRATYERGGAPAVRPGCSIDGWCKDALGADGSPLTGRHLRAVHARTKTEVYAVGDYGTLLIYDGTTWRRAPPGGPADDLFAVWAFGPSDVWVAGIIGDPDQPQGMYAHWNGARFDRIYKPLARRPQALFGFAPDDVWSVGSGGAIFRWTGMATTWQPAPAGTAESLSDVAGLGGRLWAVGSNGALLERSGGAWVTMATPTPPIAVGGLAALVAFSPTQLFAAGGNDWLEYDGTRWSHRRWPVSLDVELLGLWGATPARLWGVGPAGKAWRFEASQGTRSETGVTALLTDVHGVDEQHVWAVGFNGTVLRRYGP